MGEWLVKFRYSTMQGDGAAAAAVLRRAIAELGWPASMPPASEARPIAACTTPLRISGTAKSVPRDMASTIEGAFAGMVAASPTTTRPQNWCRDAQTLPMVGIYRPDDATDRYLFALSDSGRGIMVAPAVLALDAKAPVRWSIDFVTPGSTVQFPPQDCLPSAKRALAIVREPPVSKVATWGQKRDVTLISPPKR